MVIADPFPQGVFGDASDGTVTISGNTTLTSDMYYNNLTINSGVTLSPDGYRIFVRGTLTVTGTISVEGGNGGNGGNGAAGSGTTGGAAGTAGTVGTAGSNNRVDGEIGRAHV